MIHDICLDDPLRTSELVEVCEPIILCQLIDYCIILNSKFNWVSNIWLLHSLPSLNASLSQR
jgi:hypothetical protein